MEKEMSYEHIGYKAAYEKAYEEGYKKGYKIGIKKAKIEVAKNMLKMDINQDFIVEVTELSQSEVRQLREEQDRD
ncbi:hypothetical protein [Texcoconibacillus texcoconensis]|uniref:Putative transposase/invertase (TIGR01784 family) n=1 Tax=Texcoconibacillus texcoconensis TaxID=1095777 RepID=A0A840QM24_9BACI|nr:hypothetical protein [Texcoconibacillus texcoconensis]MBB5172425.1 putative transposase/invertase (TIGR01784 family) [Texcoconibacillus texcoconensis]